MARKPSGRSHLEEQSGNVNIIPIMGLICILIPILVYAFSFYEIKVLPVAAPKMGSGPVETLGEDQTKPLNLTVVISKEGFVLKMEESIVQGMSPIQNIDKKTFKNESGISELEYDYPMLYNKFVEIKNQFKEEKTINIGAENDIPWSAVARTIDTSRVFLEKDSYQDLTEYTKAKDRKDQKGNPVFMFPTVVFVVE